MNVVSKIKLSYDHINTRLFEFTGAVQTCNLDVI